MSNNRSKQREIVLNLLGDSLYKLPKAQKEDPKILDSPRVCKSHLIWQCPFKMLEGTRDVAVCNKIHSDRQRMLYQTLEPRRDYELEHLEQLQRCLSSCDSKIAIANARFEIAAEANDYDNNNDDDDIKMGIISQEIEALMDHGEVYKALQDSCAIESNNCNNRNNKSHQYQHQDVPTQACTVCGAIMSRLDNDRRLADHFVGRVHLAYAQIRDRADALKEQL